MPSKAADTGAVDSEHLFFLPLILQDLESVLWEAPQLFICQAAGWFLKPLLKARGQVGSRRRRLSAAAEWNAPSLRGRARGPEKAKKPFKWHKTVLRNRKEEKKNHCFAFFCLRHIHQIVAPYSPRRSERTGVRPAESEPTLGPEGHTEGRRLKEVEGCVVWLQRLAMIRKKADDASPCAQSLYLQVQSGCELQDRVTHLQPW